MLLGRLLKYNLRRWCVRGPTRARERAKQSRAISSRSSTHQVESSCLKVVALIFTTDPSSSAFFWCVCLSVSTHRLVLTSAYRPPSARGTQDWLRVVRLLAASLAASVPEATAPSALPLTSLALAPAAAGLAAGAAELPAEARPMTPARMVTMMATMPTATSGTNLTAWMGSFWAMVMKSSNFSLM